MKKSIKVSGKSTEEALENAAKELECNISEMTYEVITQAKKGFLGIGGTPCELLVTSPVKPCELAIEFIEKLIKDMDINAKVTMTDEKTGGKLISIDGEDAGILIGHHGETLDALQYLTNLVANKKEDENDDRDYTRITVDIENYRTKRTETLENLARRMANRVLKYKKNVTLEPMTPYERRIIHSTIQTIDGVTTNSIGSDNNRRVVISLDFERK